MWFSEETNEEDGMEKNIIELAPRYKETGRCDKYMEVTITGKPYFTDYVGVCPYYHAKIFNKTVFKIVEWMELIVTDITERNRAKDAWRESEERFRSFFEMSCDTIGLTRLYGQVLNINQTFLDMPGNTKVQIQSLNFRDFTPKSWGEMESEIIKTQVFKRGYSDVYEKEYIRTNGSIITVEICVVLLKEKEGNLVQKLVIAEDAKDRMSGRN